MGMDIYDRKPTGERGVYFGKNVRLWHPLVDYCITVAPDICAASRHWHTNDGYDLDAAGTIALVEVLQKEIDAGRTETYARQYASELKLMPNEPCNICAGTGLRKPGPHRGAGDLKEGGIKCNKCQGAGYVRPWASHYPFSTENVAAFVAFLRERMTKEEIVASCIAAGQAIDVETCEICWDTCNVADPYGVDPDGYVLVGRVPFVRSSESDGWVCLHWLPVDKAHALHARIKRGDVEPMHDWDKLPWED